ncbi:MAG: ABC transporter ATP-binding protein [Eubacteriales bacterium]|nr:ABC transporter ATP-binding protein [Eubacteriales bacterium]
MNEQKVSLKWAIQQFGEDKKIYATISLLLSAISGVLSILPLFYLYLLVREFVEAEFHIPMEAVRHYAILIAITQVVAILCTLLSGVASHVLAFRVEKSIRYQGIAKLMRLPISYFEAEDSGAIRRRIDDQAGQTHAYIAHNMPDMTRGMMIPLSLILLMFYIDYRLALVILAFAIVGVVVMMTMVAKTMKSEMAQFTQFGERLSVSGSEYIRGIPVVKVFQQTVERFQNFYEDILAFDGIAKRIVFGFRGGMISSTVIISAATLVLIPVALWLMSISGHPSRVFADAIFMILLSFLIYSTLMAILSINESKEQCNQALMGIAKILDTPDASVTVLPEREETGITFEDVSFTYAGRKRPAIEHFSFHFEANKSYALVGASGSGKSTLLKLLLHLYDLESDSSSGSIRVNGREVRSLHTSELCNQIAVVFQTSSLLHKSLRENITMGLDCSDEEIFNAMREAQCMDIYERIGSLDAKLGPGGTYVSGGEAQRLAIARAFLRHRPILLLDEASAFADSENEVLITAAIERLKQDTMTIASAHRLSSIRNADEILLLSEGHLVAHGPHEQLMAESNEYRAIVEEYERAAEWTIQEGQA